ncbi:MAG: tRNA dihydrouridine(20/20a) synthase DusA [Myxococcota bacterium]|nr:tRNA dihydrouridine(20/20a) synthase DusA [Myxococcota bacterium]
MPGNVHGLRGNTPPLSIAPMMNHTDRHFRVFIRHLTRETLLYTEMITTGALLHGNTENFLRFSKTEHPISLQLGGEDPEALAQCAVLAEQAGYDEVNLNVGCPSDRVKKGRFGACLMAEPNRVAEAVSAMRQSVAIPVTVKHRIGIDDLDRYEDMLDFVRAVARSGADRFSVHARKAWLSGLSPKENRNVPPLRYSDVHRLKAELPELSIEINGGFTTLDEALEQLKHVDAVMIGRAAIDNPFLFSEADHSIFGQPAQAVSRESVVSAMADYTEQQLNTDPQCRVGHIARHMLHLFHGQPGARRWRQFISENAFSKQAGPNVLIQALKAQQNH